MDHADPAKLQARRRDMHEWTADYGRIIGTRTFAGRAPRSVSALESVSRPIWADRIVAIAERGDRAAFAELFEHFAPRVKSYLVRLGAGAELADELAQETLLTVWRRAASYDPERAAPSTWVFTIARNLRIDAARRAGRAPTREDPAFLVDPPASPDAALSAIDDEARVGLAIGALPPEQARVIRLSFFSEKPHAEIAAELGLPLGTVKSRLRLAMARLRTLLESSQ